ncbi:YbbR-like domain-containing protein [Candidatus Electronema sp. PJ]|uniref:CdaR family protein n=1 Tax=Candidatus Electronema sp. PJ TaxID=3401572 RepID=UPI003AA8B705
MAMTLTVPIEFLNLPKHLVIYNQYQKEVNVTLSGPRSIMQEMRSRTLSLPVDLAEAKPDTVVLKTDNLVLPLPGGVSVVRMQPASITLSIDKLVEKQIPIMTETQGKVPHGYALQEIVLSPDNILVSGPQTLLERQQVLKTHLINLEGMMESSTIPVHLALSPELANLIGETSVAAKITVKEKIVEKIIHGIPISIRDTAGPVELKPDVISVFASIPEGLVADTLALPMLFRASIYVGSGELPRIAPVEVFAVAVPGHEVTVIKSYTPQEVELLPPGSSRQSEPAPVEEKKPEKPEKKKKKDLVHKPASQ